MVSEQTEDKRTEHDDTVRTVVPRARSAAQSILASWKGRSR